MKLRFWIATEAGSREVVADVLTSEPHCIKRPGWATRFTEGLARWSMGDTTGYGVAEHLADQKRRDE